MYRIRQKVLEVLAIEMIETIVYLYCLRKNMWAIKILETRIGVKVSLKQSASNFAKNYLG